MSELCTGWHLRWMRKLSAGVASNAAEELHAALQTWAPTLEELNVRDCDGLLDEGLCARFIFLRSLWTNTAVASVEAITKLHRLDRLVLSVRQPEEVKQLAAAIDHGALPSLQKMLVWLHGRKAKITKESAEAIQKACEKRGIAVHCWASR